MIIKISTEFSETPGARYKSEGPYSGEEFRETVLEPKFNEAKEKREKLFVDLDGGYGYPTSFLEEAFGGLARVYDSADVLKILEFISKDEPSLIDEIREYISLAKEKR